MNEVRQILTLSLPPGTVRRIALWAVIGLAFFWIVALLPTLQSLLVILVAATFLSLLLEPVVTLFENRGVNRTLSSVLVFAILVFLAIIAFKFLTPIVSQEISSVSAGISDESSTNAMQQLQDKLGDNIPFFSSPAVQVAIKKKVDLLMKSSLTMVVDILSAIMSMFMAAFITFFFLKDGRRIKKRLISWMPNRYFEMSLILIHRIATQLGRYIRGQLLVSLIVGSMSVFALYLLDVRYYFFIGALAGLANMIPYFGPLVGAMPAIIVAFLDTGEVGSIAAVAVAFGSIQMFESVLVAPYIVSKSVELHPLTIILVVLTGGKLLGIFGMLLAVPVSSIIKVMSVEISWGLQNYRVFD